MTDNTPETGDTDAGTAGSVNPSGADDGSEDPGDDGSPGGDDRTGQFYDALETLGRPVVTATRYAQLREQSQADAAAELDSLAGSGTAERLDVSSDPVVWYPTDWARMTDRERLVVFPERRTLVADQPTQFTRAQLTQFAHLLDTTGSGSYLYEIRPEDVWQAPYETFADLLGTIRSVLPEREPALEEWMEDQHRRASQFTLRTHEDGYVVLEAESADVMGNVARQKLDDGQLRAPVSDTESWVAEESLAEVKRVLYEAGYPVRDERDLEQGDPLPVDLELELRGYQQTWVSNFMERQSGVLVGPPGSGKTVAALAILAAVEGETLILVPGRELAGQWREELLAKTTLDPDQVGEYHGGTKEIQPVTIATYRTAGMDRHRHLFDSREWGLVVYDECHNLPTPIHRRTAGLQTRHRLGLSVDGETMIPVRSKGELDMVRIEDFATRYLGEDTGIAAVEDVQTLSVTQEGAVQWTAIQSVMRHQHDGRMYNVRARNGREISVTPDHSLMVFDGESMCIEAKPPRELGETDYLLQPVSVPDTANAASSIDVLSLVEDGYVILDSETPDNVFEPLYEENIGDNKRRYNWKSRKNLPLEVAREIQVDREHIIGVYTHKRDCYVPPSVDVEDFARLVGLFVADGTFGDNRIEFYAADTDDVSELSEFKNVIRAVCPKIPISVFENGKNCQRLRVSGPLRNVLANLGLENGARDKHIPPLILSNQSAYESFVDGVVLGDGHRQTRTRNRAMTTVSTSSERLRAGLGFVLSALSHVGGNYKRETTVPIRSGDQDTVPNNLIRFNPNRRDKQSRLAMTPFTERLQETYQDIPRYESKQADSGPVIESGLGNRQRLNEDELELLLERSNLDCEWLRDTDVAMLEIDTVDITESEEYVYDISTSEQNFLGNTLFCHNSSTPVREDEQESEIFTLVGPPIGTDWDALFEAGYVAEPAVEIRYLPWDGEDSQNEYVSATGHERRQLAATNPAKRAEVQALLAEAGEQQALVFVEYLEQGQAIADALGVPFISGETPHHRREKLFEQFREGQRRTLVVSRVGDEGIDLPNAELAIVASGLGGSRRQGTQRAGRTMRPTGRARMYVLATRGSREEEFARQRMRYLAEKGVRVTEHDAGPDLDDTGPDDPPDG